MKSVTDEEVQVGNKYFSATIALDECENKLMTKKKNTVFYYQNLSPMGN